MRTDVDWAHGSGPLSPWAPKAKFRIESMPRCVLRRRAGRGSRHEGPRHVVRTSQRVPRRAGRGRPPPPERPAERALASDGILTHVRPRRVERRLRSGIERLREDCDDARLPSLPRRSLLRPARIAAEHLLGLVEQQLHPIPAFTDGTGRNSLLPCPHKGAPFQHRFCLDRRPGDGLPRGAARPPLRTGRVHRVERHEYYRPGAGARPDGPERACVRALRLPVYDQTPHLRETAGGERRRVRAEEPDGAGDGVRGPVRGPPPGPRPSGGTIEWLRWGARAGRAVLRRGAVACLVPRVLSWGGMGTERSDGGRPPAVRELRAERRLPPPGHGRSGTKTLVPRVESHRESRRQPPGRLPRDSGVQDG